jgi:hypothetical protein
MTDERREELDSLWFDETNDEQTSQWRNELTSPEELHYIAEKDKLFCNRLEIRRDIVRLAHRRKEFWEQNGAI